MENKVIRFEIIIQRQFVLWSAKAYRIIVSYTFGISRGLSFLSFLIGNIRLITVRYLNFVIVDENGKMKVLQIYIIIQIMGQTEVLLAVVNCHSKQSKWSSWLCESKVIFIGKCWCRPMISIFTLSLSASIRENHGNLCALFPMDNTFLCIIAIIALWISR